MSNKRKKIVAWRVMKEHVEPLKKLVQPFLNSLDYKMYEKRKTKRKKAKH